jgi:hypothetical protein
MQVKAGGQTELAAYSIDTFCNAHDITRGFLYQLWKEGRGPDSMTVGRRRLISREEARRWRERMTRETAAASGALPSKHYGYPYRR